MFTLSMLKHGSRNNCTTMHVNHTEDLKHDCVRVLPLHKKLTTSKTWTVAYANGNTTAEFIHFHFNLASTGSVLISYVSIVQSIAEPFLIIHSQF